MTGKLAITSAAFDSAAKRLGCEPAAVRAVAEVESNGSGFLADGQVKILFEPHIFSRRTGGRFDKSHPDISYPKWDRARYGAGGQHQHNKLQRAAALDRDAAIESASWGAFQIMGFNWKVCGYGSLQAFINDVSLSADGQLRAFVGYCIGRGLADELQRKDWVGFASAYNGPGYAANQYDSKLAAAYRRHARG